jgi:hypothetical protein
MILKNKHTTVLRPDMVGPRHPEATFGLGDVVEVLAKPVAIVSDAVLKTNWKNCVGCGERKAALNQAVPDVNPIHLLR